MRNKKSINATQKRKPVYVLILFLLFVATSCEFSGTTKSTEDQPKSTEDQPKSTEDQPKSTAPANISLPLPTKLYSGYIEDFKMGSSFSDYEEKYTATGKNIQYDQKSKMYEGENARGSHKVGISFDKNSFSMQYENSYITQRIIANIASKKFVNIPTTDHTILQIVLENVKYLRSFKESEKIEAYDFKGFQIQYFFIHNDRFYYIGTHEDIADGNYMPMYRYLSNKDWNDEDYHKDATMNAYRPDDRTYWYGDDADENGYTNDVDEYLYDYDAYHDWYEYTHDEAMREYGVDE